MRVVPVLDLMAGRIVRGIGGRRESYQPIVSALVSSSDPLEVARAFRERYGFTQIYLADLDAIAGASPALPVYATLQTMGLSLWVDAGLRTVLSLEPLARAGIASVVVGMETLAGREALEALLAAIGPDRLVFSLDLKGSRPLSNNSTWAAADPWRIACEVVALGVKRILVLDLARVGMGQGTGTEQLCDKLSKTYSGVEVSAGGGVEGLDDLITLKNCGVENVLVASALHDGRIRAEDITKIDQPWGPSAGLHS
jgi:phosphoribosylformimino-5-aminoimidazole carboxamide ribotide isomerase